MMANAPTLHEIAAMPFPASVEAMREFYNPRWGKPVPDGVERAETYHVDVEYYIEQHSGERVTIKAFSEEEAEELAMERLNKHFSDTNGFLIESASARKAEQDS